MTHRCTKWALTYAHPPAYDALTSCPCVSLTITNYQGNHLSYQPLEPAPPAASQAAYPNHRAIPERSHTPVGEGDPDALMRYHAVLAQSLTMQTHRDVLLWLQGDMQPYLAHDILLVAWGRFSTGEVQHDIVSAMNGVRTQRSNARALIPLLQRFHTRWDESGHSTFALSAGTSGFLLDRYSAPCALGTALQRMHSALVHGVKDLRGGPDCLYVAFSAADYFDARDCRSLDAVLPTLDNVLRRIAYLPQQGHANRMAHDMRGGRPVMSDTLTGRELEILGWIAMGKTNPEIGSILEISLFTVKNHIQRIFRKLNVSNRAQAVAMLKNDG